MNLYELSTVITPLMAALAGAAAIKSPGAVPKLEAAGLGLVIGIGFALTALGLEALLVKVMGVGQADGQGPRKRLADLTYLAIPLLGLAAATVLSGQVASRIVQLRWDGEGGLN